MPRYTNIQVRENIIRLSNEGKSSREIALIMNVGKTTVNDLIKKFRTGDGLQDRPKSGRPRKTSQRIDNAIKRKSNSEPRKTASDIANELREESGLNISRMTVSRRLHQFGLFGRVGAKKPLVSKKNQKRRCQFAREHWDWTFEQWQNVLFSDESKFNLFGSDGKKYVRRPKNTRFDSRYQIPTVKHGGGSVMVWGAFSANGVGPLIQIEGRMNGIMYREILHNNLLQYAAAKMGPSWIFQHDNDPKHTSAVVKKWLIKKKINVLKFPAQSPDLNPIEHLWDELGRRVGCKRHKNKTELFETLKNVWLNIPATTITNLIKSMPSRCAAVIAARGMATKY